jgi:amidohydrolase
VRHEVGSRELEGEAGQSLAERMQVRPTLDCNGIWGGFTGEGEKTVIPAVARAKVSMRLVPDQDPEEVFRAFADYVPTLGTPGVEIEVRRLSSAPPVLLGTEQAPARAVARAYEEAFGRATRQLRSGGSIPVAIDLAKLGQPMVCSGFPQADCAVHSPNENCALDNVRLGVEMMLRLFWALPEELGQA